MKVGRRSQVGIGSETEVEFRVARGEIPLRKSVGKLNLDRWKGHSGKAFAKLGYSSIDRFIDDVRGR